MTGALILLVTLLLFRTVHDPYFPKERLFPSAVSTLMQMFLYFVLGPFSRPIIGSWALYSRIIFK